MAGQGPKSLFRHIASFWIGIQPWDLSRIVDLIYSFNLTERARFVFQGGGAGGKGLGRGGGEGLGRGGGGGMGHFIAWNMDLVRP